MNKRRDGQHDRVGESGDGFGGFEQTGQHQRNDHDQRDHVHAQPFGDEEEDGEEQDAQRQLHLKSHRCNRRVGAKTCFAPYNWFIAVQTLP